MDSTRVSAKEVINEVFEATNLEPDDSTECNFVSLLLTSSNYYGVIKFIIRTYKTPRF